MALPTKPLYETDFAEWAGRTADLLREGRYSEIDMENVAEEIESLGRNNQSAVRSQLRRVLVHVIKMKLQPERSGTSWRVSIISGQTEILDRFDDAPSLRRHLEANLAKIYRQAVREAERETKLASQSGSMALPANCPFTLDELLDGEPEDLVAKL